jgi:hypothetical protein
VLRSKLDDPDFARGLIGGGEGFALARCLPQIDVGAQVAHHSLELNEIQGLGAVADGFFWGGMDFDDQAVRADGYAGAGYRGHEAALSGGVAGIQDDRQVR